MADDLIAQKLGILLLQAKAVIFLFPIPFLQLDNQIDGLRILDALDSEQCLYINDSDTAQLDKMSCDIRCTIRSASHH